MLLLALALLPLVLASCDPKKDINQLICSKGFADGKRLGDLSSVQQFSGCGKLLLAECTTFEGLGHNCNNPACDPMWVTPSNSLEKVPQFLWPARRSTLCQDGCSMYMPRAQLCTVCRQKADEALNEFGEVVATLAYVFATQRSTILKGSGGHRRLLASSEVPSSPQIHQALGLMKDMLAQVGSSGASAQYVEEMNKQLGKLVQQGAQGSQPEQVAKQTQTPSVRAATVGDVTSSMAMMDATDQPVRASIESPVPEGNTMAKFGSVSNGIVWTPSTGGFMESDAFNGLKRGSPLYTPAPASGFTFPTDKLREYTLLLQQRDSKQGGVVTYGMDKLQASLYKTLKIWGLSIYDSNKNAISNKVTWGYDPQKPPSRIAGKIMGDWADTLVDGIGSAVSKSTEALSDTLFKFFKNNDEEKQRLQAIARNEKPPPSSEPFLAKPTSFLSWLVDYQQSMQCFYSCLGWVLDCLQHLNKPPHCYEDCFLSKGVESLAGTRLKQLEKYTGRCH